jgi:hypothetical protein
MPLVALQECGAAPRDDIAMAMAEIDGDDPPAMTARAMAPHNHMGGDGGNGDQAKQWLVA